METQVQPAAAPANPGVPASALRPPKWEFWAVLLMLAAFFGFNLATCSDYPAAWCDEIWFSEPAVNLVQYGSFTTMVWEYQTPGTFPAVNCPLYLMALAPWLSVAGTTLLAIRSFNYALMAIAALLTWAVAWRFNLVKAPSQRLLLVALLHLGYGMSYSYRCSRPDILALTCLLLLLLSFSIRRQPLRDAALLVLSGLTVCIGLQVGLFAGFACLMACLILRQAGLRELVLVSVGMAGAAGLLLFFFAWKGVLSPFLAITVGFLGKQYAHQPHLSAGAAALKIIRYSFISDDLSLVVVALGLAVLLAAAWKRLNGGTRRLVLYCLALVVGVPLLFNLVGHFATYYSYMKFVPAVLAIFAVYSDLTSASKGFGPALRLVFLATLVAAMAVGLPLRLAVTAATAKIAPREEIQRVIASHIRPDDVVFSEYACFFEVKRTARAAYDRFCSSVLLPTPIPGRDLTPEQKRSVSVLVIRPGEKDLLMRYFGGNWQATSAPFGDRQDFSLLTRLPVIGSRFASYASQPQTERFQLQVFRRLAGSANFGPAAPAQAGG